jgi:serine/threonine protein phosphatase 1
MIDFGTTITDWKHMRQSVNGEQLFVIGDIHGQAEALRATLFAVASIPRATAHRRLVLLGDIIDRGPASLQAIYLAEDARDLALVDDVIILPGNHELMLIDAIDNPMMFMGDWLDNGGERLIEEIAPECTARMLADFAKIVRQAVPVSFLEQMRTGPTSLLLGDLLMVHAGLNPEREAFNFLAEPRMAVVGNDHWAWIREPFLRWQGGWGPQRKWAVVHGHTPAVSTLVSAESFAQAADKLSDHSRICLDAGSANGNPQIGWAEFRDGSYRIGITGQSCDSGNDNQ